MRLGGRNDLTVAQRETVQDIWANWSVRRAAAAMDNGNIRRAVDILDAASQAFPDNMTVRKAVAGGYARVGRAKESLALFKTVPMQDATLGRFSGRDRGGAGGQRQDAGRAMAAPGAGSLSRAIRRFFRLPRATSRPAATISALPTISAPRWRPCRAASPVDRLAHELVYPEQDMKAHRAVTAADLQHLLDPDYEPFAKTTKVPPLPAYGPDPYDGSAPVVLTQPQSPSQQAPAATPANSFQPSRNQLPAAPDSNPAVTTIPRRSRRIRSFPAAERDAD